MRTSARLKFASLVALSFALCAAFTGSPTSARFLDDDSQPPAKPAAASADPKKAKDSSADSSAGLTERERMLLDRVEQLEKRVAELESARGSSGSLSTAATNASANAAALGAPTVNAIAANPASLSATPASAASASSVATTVNSSAPSLAPTSSTPSSLGAAAPSRGDAAGLATAAAASSTPQQASVPAQTAAIAATEKPAASAPFAFADFTWLNGNPRTKDVPLDTKFFTPEIRSDVDYIYDFRHPKDDTISGSSEVFRSNEVQLTQLGIGGDFHYDNVRARLMTQFGLYSETTPRNDSSPARGQWNLADAYRYLSEAYGGYHFNVMHGINVDAGIFMSYVGLFSYYQFDNWAYQPSYVSSNTPWFFNGVRVQIFPTEHLKIEPWFVNGWQSYGRFNNRPGIGFQILYRPNGWLSVLGNQYMLGEDALNTPGRVRYHTDDSIEVKYYDKPENFIDKMAFSLTGDLGCEHGGGVSCYTNSAKGPKQDFLGFMFYNRVWFDHDLFGLTIGGGKINNPGRYLVLLPPINGATAASGTAYFTENPGDPYKAWDMSATFDWMPSQYITWRWEYNYRAANVPYFSGPGGVTPPGGNQGAPGSAVPGWAPALRKSENRLNMAILVKF